MKVVVRSSSLLFFVTNILLGLPVRRNRVRNGEAADKKTPPPALSGRSRTQSQSEEVARPTLLDAPARGGLQ